jgi:DNA polymerase-3 subunit alpha
VHYTAEFYAANMTVEMDDTDKLKVLLDDAKLFGIASSRRTSTAGSYRFEPVDTSWSATAWARSRARASSAIEAIVAARDGGWAASAACSTSAPGSTASG